MYKYFYETSQHIVKKELGRGFHT